TEKIFQSPRHPYTQMLMASVPRLDQKWDTRINVESKGAQTGHPDGCVYFDRCPLAFEKCRQRPVPVEIESDHFVACWKVTEAHA
ncbi:MAG: oligopeptide/dipeptide ABC transporter ATP-binding protein, partial [Chloroflexota bacterium]